MIDVNILLFVCILKSTINYSVTIQKISITFTLSQLDLCVFFCVILYTFKIIKLRAENFCTHAQTRARTHTHTQTHKHTHTIRTYILYEECRIKIVMTLKDKLKRLF